jgi:hypothetical protein
MTDKARMTLIIIVITVFSVAVSIRLLFA